MSKLILWTAKDVSTWGRLLTIAQECAADPSRPMGELGRAVEKAEKAIIPTRDEEARAKIFLLWKFAKTFAAMDLEGRAVNAAQLAEHARAAQAIIAPQTGDVVSLAQHRAAPPSRFRADIDG